MLIYTIRRFFGAIPTFFGVITVVFIVMRLVPGDPAILMLGDNATREAVEALREDLGLNRPLFTQYLSYIGNVFQGDFGTSLRTNRPVLSEISRLIPYTVELAIAGILIGAVIGISAGVITALRRNTIIDYVVSALATIGIAMPVFTLGIILLVIFSYNLGWFPAISAGRGGSLGETFRSLALPAAALGFSSAAIIARMTRSSVLEILNQDFIRTARAKGLSQTSITLSHVLKNALIPVVTIIGLNFGRLMSGTVITETLFVRPGLGRLLIDSIYARDYTQVEATVAFFALSFIMINLLVDLTYAALDPRIQYS